MLATKLWVASDFALIAPGSNNVLRYLRFVAGTRGATGGATRQGESRLRTFRKNPRPRMGGPPQAQLVAAPKTFTVTARQTGQVFSLALDDADPPIFTPPPRPPTGFRSWCPTPMATACRIARAAARRTLLSCPACSVRWLLTAVNRNYIDGAPDKPAARKERVTEPKPKRKEEKERAAPAQKSVPPPAAAQPAPPPAAAVPPQPRSVTTIIPMSPARSGLPAPSLNVAMRRGPGTPKRWPPIQITSRPWATPARFTSHRAILRRRAPISIASRPRAARRAAANIASSKA